MQPALAGTQQATSSTAAAARQRCGDRSGNNNNNDNSSEEWKLSYSVALGEMRGVAMPEPQHRIGPAGVSSGVSLRSLPPARLEDLTKIC
ncbi:unnamed protein product, partial [Ectocarpus sp. 6 AP-2014]